MCWAGLSSNKGLKSEAGLGFAGLSIKLVMLKTHFYSLAILSVVCTEDKEAE